MKRYLKGYKKGQGPRTEAAADANINKRLVRYYTEEWPKILKQLFVPAPTAAISVQPGIPKGEKGGECNRTACSNKRAVFFNHSTEKYYCPSCAQAINDANRADAMRLFGHDLCTLNDAIIL